MDIPSLFFDQHPNPMFIFDIDTLEVLEVNKSAVDKYGYSRDEFLTLTIEDIRPPEDIPHLHEMLEDVKGKSQICDLGTLRHQTKGGDILYVQITAQKFPKENKNARIVHVHDITETTRLKKQAEEAYHEQQLHIDNNPLGMMKYDKNHRIIEWSQRAEEKTGYSKDDVLGNSVFEMDFFVEGEAEYVEKRMQAIAAGKQDKDRFETVIRIKDGSKMNVLIHASGLRNKKGELKSVLAFIENITDRKEYERQLEYRERKYHRLFEDANDGIFLLNDLQIIDCNDRITEIFGSSKEEIIGKSPLDFSPAKQHNDQLSSEMAKEKMQLAKDGEPQVFEWKHRTVDGELIDTEISLNKIELGEESYIQAIVRNITEQKKIKNELETDQKRLKRAQKLARIGWWSYEAKENRIIWSDVLYDILDVDKDNFEATFEAFNSLVHPEDREKLEGVMARAQESEQVLDYVLKLQNSRDDEIIYAKCRAKSKLDNEGQLVRLSGVLQDITERKKAQDELKRNKELFESLFLNSPVAIVMIDMDGKVQKLNRSFEELFGYSEEELIGKDLLKHQLPEERYEETDGIYEHVFSEEGTSKYYEDQRITKSGETKDLLIGALPVNLNGDIIAAFGIYIDITKLRATEQHLKNSLKEKEILLSEVHHRVKNNLAVISGLLELESMNLEESEEARNVLSESMLRIKSISMIHEQLYKSEDFANLEFDNYVYKLVNTVSDTLNFEDKEISLDVDSDNVKININQAIPCALIVNELVTNAYEHGFKGLKEGKLKVKMKQEGDEIRILVADNGRGLPCDFEFDETSSLGLSMVQQLTKQLNGELTIQNRKGTQFEITFRKEKKSGSASNYFV